MTSRLVPITLPIRGLNTVNPYIDPSSGYARELTNYSIIDGALKVRPAIRTYIEDNAAITGRFNHIYASNAIPAVISGITSAGTIYTNIATNTTSGNIGGAVTTNSTYLKHLSLDYVIGNRAPRLRASPFTAWTITPISITDTNITSACSHKGRLYYSDGTNIEYTDIGQITGAVSSPTGGKLVVSSFMDNQTILRMFSITINPGNNVDNVFVIFGNAGKVLIYTGDYPGSSSWELIGKYNMPAPINNISFCEIDGDVMVVTPSYAYWLLALITGNIQTAYLESPTIPIENFWQEWASGGSSNPEETHVYYIDKIGSVTLDAVIIQFSILGTNYWANYQNEAGCLVYFRKYKAWALWLGSPFFKPVTYAVNNYYGTGYNSSILKYDSTILKDQYSSSGTSTDISIEATWKTPYYSPYEGQYQKVNAVRSLFKNTISGFLEKIRVIFDFSDLNSSYGFYTQSTVTQINPGNYADGQIDIAAVSSNQYNVFKNVGAKGAGFSIQLTQKAKSGSSSTQEQGLFPASVLVESGGVIF